MNSSETTGTSAPAVYCKKCGRQIMGPITYIDIGPVCSICNTSGMMFTAQSELTAIKNELSLMHMTMTNMLNVLNDIKFMMTRLTMQG